MLRNLVPLIRNRWIELNSIAYGSTRIASSSSKRRFSSLKVTSSPAYLRFSHQNGTFSYSSTTVSPNSSESINDLEIVEGPWRDFNFKMLTPAHYDKVLDHLRECLYSQALGQLGYDKSMEKDYDVFYKLAFERGGKDNNLSFFAEHSTTGKVVGARMTLAIDRTTPVDVDMSIFSSSKFKDIMKFMMVVDEECNDKIFKNYNVDKYAYLFGISVHPTYYQGGLGMEMYRRAMLLLKARGFELVKVGFMNPYSRKIAQKSGFKELARRSFEHCVDADGKLTNPDMDTSLYLDLGVIEL